VTEPQNPAEAFLYLQTDEFFDSHAEELASLLKDTEKARISLVNHSVTANVNPTEYKRKALQ
jgi:hypothetical protein